MAKERLSMRKLREILRLKFDCHLTPCVRIVVAWFGKEKKSVPISVNPRQKDALEQNWNSQGPGR